MIKQSGYKIFDEDFELREARLPFTITMGGAANAATKGAASAAAPAVTMSGHTRGLSAGELELVAPFSLFTGRTPAGADATLRVTVELPTGPVQMSAVKLSYTRLDDYETDVGYLVAARGDTGAPAAGPDLSCVIRARVTEVGDDDRAEVVRYLRSLEQATPQTVYVVAQNGQWMEQTVGVTVLA